MTERLQLRVGAVAHGGHCVARHEGRVVFVRHAIPGELVTADITDGGESSAYWRAEAVEIHEPSPHRVASAWPEAGPHGVGGGELAHVSLPAQRKWKKAVIVDAFERFANSEFLGEVAAAPGDDSRGGLGYRTRVQAVANARNKASMHLHRSRELRALEEMPLATPEVERALLARSFPKGAAITIVEPSAGEEPRAFVNGAAWGATGPDRRPNAPTHVREVVHWAGKDFEYRVAATGFWQVHREAASVLLAEVMAQMGDAARVLDLYAGSGLFTLPLAATGREVTSVESAPDAAKGARRNLHAYPNATVVHGDVRQYLRLHRTPCDAALLDPPRSGAGRSTLEALAAVSPQRVVYVACDPVALARDVAHLRDLGYDLTHASAHDLFPMTHHVEAIATFDRR